MDVLINSDILFHGGLVTDSLSHALCRLLDACREHGHRVVLPETATLEWDRQQMERVVEARAKLNAAYVTLERHGVPFERRDPAEVINPPELVSLIANRGVEVSVERPTPEDYEDAHRRACLHSAPQPPNSKSDEMRDLVIWAISLRIATTQDQALLVSRDEVHTHERGDAEADSVGLRRARSIEDALEVLQVGTPAGRLFSNLLSPAWDALREAGLPVGSSPRLTGVLAASLVQGEDGSPELAEADVTVASDGVRPISGHVEIRAVAGERQRVRFTSVRAGEEYIQPRVAECPSELKRAQVADIQQRIDGLREVVEGES